MRHRIIALIATICVFLSHSAVFAAEDVDYQDEVTELKEMIAECEQEGFSVEYEKINCSVLEMFEQYLNDDADAGIDQTGERWIYNVSAMDKLYQDTKSSLEAYLEGTKKSFHAELPGMLNLKASGTSLYNNSELVFSIGYGHTTKARKDIESFNSVGANNIQVEIGPNQMLYTLGGWRNGSTVEGGTLGLSSLIKNDGSNSLKIKNTSSTGYKRLYQYIDYKDGVTYEFGCMGNTNGSTLGAIVYISAAAYTADIKIESSSTWKEYSATYTHDAELHPNPQFAILYDKVSGNGVNAYLDDFYLYELDSNGNRVGDNLLKNPGFEIDWGYDDCISHITEALEKAEEQDVGASLLLSPHYLSVDKDSDLYTSKGVFIKYNINAEETRTAIEEYLRNLLPYLTEYKALQNICISNEPVFNTMNFTTFYNPLFRDYLIEKHGSLENLNKAYGSEYQSIEDISIPASLEADPLCYDWIEFNDKNFTDWHIWMKNIVKEYLPDTPVHSKMMKYFSPRSTGIPGEDTDRDILARGTDLELFATFSDYMGNDTYDYVYQPETYYKTMFTYDYMHSVSDKPIYNSEDHIIKNRTENFNTDQLRHWRNNLWMGAVHGRNMSTIWGWDRTYNTSSDLYLGALSRPDIIAETGRTNLDLNRLSNEVTKVGKNSDVAIFYSKPSRLYGDTHLEELMEVYKNLLNIGQKPGVVSDMSIDRLENYKVLIMSGVTNCYEKTAEVINSFIENGGRVIYTGELPTKNEYNRAVIDNSYISQNAYEYAGEDNGGQLQEWFRRWGMQSVYLIDNATGEIPVDMDWQYVIDGEQVLVNVTSLDYDTDKNISVYLDGEKLDCMTDIITDTDMQDEILLSGYTPMLLEYEIIPETESEIMSIEQNGSSISWCYSGNTYSGARVYRLMGNGNLAVFATVSGTSIDVPSEEYTYVVKALDKYGMESSGRIISVIQDSLFSIDIVSAEKADGDLNCVVSLKNTHTSFASGVVLTEVKDAGGNVIKYNYQKMTLRKGQEDSFRLSMSVPDTAAEITVSVYDSIVSRNLYSNTESRLLD